MKRPLALYKVSAFGTSIIVRAKTPGNAVWQFRKGRDVALQTDNDTGGWKGVSVDCIGKAKG